jgi:4,5-dihydroxyphthalate decarboxylase
LTLASIDYLDRTRALFDGSVVPDSIELRCLRFTPYELFQRVAQKVEFDVAEMSVSTYLSLLSRGDDRYVALPVFLSRHFRHGYVFVHGGSAIHEPKDLVGKRVGVPEYEMTAALWQRAFLEHDYDVSPRQITWLQGGEFAPGFVERQKLPTPEGVTIGFIPEDRTLHEMLAAGEIDALCSPFRPKALTDGSGRVRRLFPDFVSVEQTYFRRTGFFPIMHLTVLRRDLYQREPWVAASMTHAFVRAQKLGWDRLEQLGALAVMLPWLTRDLEEIDATVGRSGWTYGFEENRAILTAMCGYSHEQGLSARLLTPEEVFAPETHALRVSDVAVSSPGSAGAAAAPPPRAAAS